MRFPQKTWSSYPVEVETKAINANRKYIGNSSELSGAFLLYKPEKLRFFTFYEERFPFWPDFSDILSQNTRDFFDISESFLFFVVVSTKPIVATQSAHIESKPILASKTEYEICTL